jgi:sortase B
MKKWICNILILLCAGIFIYAAYQLGTTLWGYYQNRLLQNEIQDIFYGNNTADRVNGSEEEDSSRETEITGLEALQNYNEDTVGWLEIPCAYVDHPVMQSYDNDYYLHRDFYQKYRYAGTLFIDYRNDLEGQYQNIIIYGHRMMDGSMFGKLGNYLTQSVLEENPTFTFSTLDGTYQCEVFAVYRCKTDFPYAQPTFANAEEFLDYVAMCRKASLYQTDTEISAQDMIMTLSTCDKRYDETTGRLVVQAKMIKVTDEAETVDTTDETESE